MAYDLSKILVIGISSRALFDLEEEHQVFEKEGLEAFTQYQIANENSILKPGTAFPLVQAVLNLNNKILGERKIEVMILSRNNSATSLRVFNSIKHYGLDITRSVWSGGTSLVGYLNAFQVDLYLSANESDIQAAIEAGIAAAKIYSFEQAAEPISNQIRIAFDADCVIFGSESERVFQDEGLDAFHEHERVNAKRVLSEGPFGKLLKAISLLQAEYGSVDSPIRTCLITARSSPAHERVIRTLAHWGGVRIDEAFFLGGVEKTQVLKAFKPNIYFDDMAVHCQRAAGVVPTARVPYVQGAL